MKNVQLASLPLNSSNGQFELGDTPKSGRVKKIKDDEQQTLLDEDNCLSTHDLAR